MTRDPERERLLDYITGDDDEAAHEALRVHLGDTDAAWEEAERLRTLWAKLGDLPDEQPSPWLRMQFYAMLERYGRPVEPTKPSLWVRFKGWLTRWGPRRLALQVAVAACMLCIGLGAGYLLHGGAAQPEGNAVGQLRDEVAGLRKLVALSLLQQPLATERLRGVSWSAQLAQPDEEVVTALLRTLRHDPNVNVRLAAVDALAPLADRAPVQQALTVALLEQEAPLVQMALIDVLVSVRATQAQEALRQMIRNDTLEEDLRVHAEQGLQTLL